MNTKRPTLTLEGTKTKEFEDWFNATTEEPTPVTEEELAQDVGALNGRSDLAVARTYEDLTGEAPQLSRWAQIWVAQCRERFGEDFLAHYGPMPPLPPKKKKPI